MNAHLVMIHLTNSPFIPDLSEEQLSQPRLKSIRFQYKPSNLPPTASNNNHHNAIDIKPLQLLNSKKVILKKDDNVFSRKIEPQSSMILVLHVSSYQYDCHLAQELI